MNFPKISNFFHWYNKLIFSNIIHWMLSFCFGRHQMKLCTWYLTPCKLQLRPVSLIERAKSLAFGESLESWMVTFIKIYGTFVSCQLSILVFSSIIPVGGELSASIEPILSPVILKMWASHVSDPFISIDLIEVLEVILAKYFFFIDVLVSECTGLYGILILRQFLFLCFQVQ